MASTSRVARTRRALTALAVVALAVHAVHALPGVSMGVPDALLDTWLYDAVIIAAAFAVLARGALVPGERRVWLALGGGLLCWAAGEVLWSITPAPASPSVADVLYLLFYPGAYVAIVTLARAPGTTAPRGLWLDGLIAALVVAALGAALVFEPVLHATDGAAAAVATNLAYPLSDILLDAMIVGLLAVSGWRVDRRWGLFVLAFAINAVADGVYLFQGAAGTYVEGGLVDTGWMAAAVLFAATAWQPSRPWAPAPADDRARALVIPAVAATGAVAVLAYGNARPIGTLAVVLAVSALAGVVARMTTSVRANHRLLRASRAEALTDPLTGLGNRRALLRDLEAAVADGAGGTPRLLVVFDLNGFKDYNDTFGHPAGDALLQRVGGALAAHVGPRGHAYRAGGDEFCALMEPDGRAPAEQAADAAAALLEHGDGFSIGAAFGEALLPTEATAASEALRVADHRLYANKASGRASAGAQVRDALLSVLRERTPDLDVHNDHVIALAAAVGAALGLVGRDLDDLLHAAALHDVGKAAIPEEILGKPGPLTPEERAFVDRHTIIGHRILAAAPALRRVGTIVRASHERVDGGGYPDGLAGDAIPLAARVVAVCDAYDAMTSDRPYRRALPHAVAAAELRRCAGTQFDAGIVEVFLRVAEGAAVGSVADGHAGDDRAA